MLAAGLLQRDPAGLGGIVLRGAGLARDVVLEALGPMLRMPVGIDDEALIGARDLAATLAGEVVIERDGATARHLARFALVLLDDGQGDERVADRLAERCAFWFDLADVRRAGLDPGSGVPSDRPERASLSPDQVEADEGLGAIAGASIALGIDSVRAPLMALRVAAFLRVGKDALATGARLVLAHRATRAPAPGEAPPPPRETQSENESQVVETLDDIVLGAVTVALPADLLARIAAEQGRQSSKASGHGERRRSPTRGRPLGARAGLPRGGARLALIDTLRAAASWQRLRGASGRIAIRREDIRIKRFETRAEATTIFAVDASGSAAAQRLAEAKGAVELLLAEAYVKRTEAALIAFRGSIAEVLLPPTRSLTRARRELAELPGGGGTPQRSRDSTGIGLQSRSWCRCRSISRTCAIVS